MTKTQTIVLVAALEIAQAYLLQRSTGSLLLSLIFIFILAFIP